MSKKVPTVCNAPNRAAGAGEMPAAPNPPRDMNEAFVVRGRIALSCKAAARRWLLARQPGEQAANAGVDAFLVQ
jgi:hypothetical protein